MILSLKRRWWSVIVAVYPVCKGYIWPISDTDRLSFSEGFMFGYKAEPWSWLSSLPAPHVVGKTYIKFSINSTVHVVSSAASSDEFGHVRVLAFARNSEGDHDKCDSPPSQQVVIRTLQLTDDHSQKTFTGDLKGKFLFEDDGVQNFEVLLCSGERSADLSMTLRGWIEFKNPTGYLPAQYFGYLPFKAALCAILSLAFVVHAVRCCCYCRTLRQVQHLVSMGLLIAAAEAASWSITLDHINHTGTPLCCPFLPGIVVAMAAHGIRRLTTRTVLLCIAHGIGTGVGVRVGAACVKILVYVVAYAAVLAMVLLAAVSATQDKGTNYFVEPNDVNPVILPWLIPEAALELFVLAWFYRAAASTLSFLRATSQTAELGKLKCLVRTVTACVVVAAVYTVGVYGLQVLQNTLVRWPYSLYWARFINTDLFSLVLLLSIATHWQPTSEPSKIDVNRMVVGSNADDEDFEETDPIEDEEYDIPEDDSNRMPTKPPIKKGNYEGLASRDEDEDVELARKRD